MENHLKMLQTFAEEQVEQYVSDVVNKGTTDAKVGLNEICTRCHQTYIFMHTHEWEDLLSI